MANRYLYIYIYIGPRRSSDDTPNPASWKQPHPRLCFISAGPIELHVLTVSTPLHFPVCRQSLGRWDKSGIVHHERHVHVETIPFVVPEDLVLFTCPAQLLSRRRLPPCWQRQQPSTLGHLAGTLVLQQVAEAWSGDFHRFEVSVLCSTKYHLARWNNDMTDLWLVRSPTVTLHILGYHHFHYQIPFPSCIHYICSSMHDIFFLHDELSWVRHMLQFLFCDSVVMVSKQYDGSISPLFLHRSPDVKFWK